MNYYENLRVSLIAFAKTIADDVQSFAPTIQHIDFDTFAEPNLLPETDLVGPFQFDMSDEGQLISARTMFVVSTVSDLNLFRLNKIVGAAYSKLRPDMSIPLIDASNGSELGRLYIQEGVSVMPLDYSSNRPMKAIAVGLKSTLASG